MKRLLIIRHAKSAHGPKYKSDFERPLNTRGRKDAFKMADQLAKSLDKLDCLLVSSAKRTTETASYFIEAFDLAETQVIYSQALYLPEEDKIWELSSKIDPKYNTVGVVTHNFAVEDLLHRFRPDSRCPTCSVVELHFDKDDWSDINPSNVRFVSHKYPKLNV